MIVSETSFKDYGRVKKKKKEEKKEDPPLSQTEMKERRKFARELHNKRAKNIKDQFSHLSVFQEGGSLENLVIIQ